MDVIKGADLPVNVKQNIQDQNSEDEPHKPTNGKSVLYSNTIAVLSKVAPSTMKETQELDIDIGKVVEYVNVGQKPIFPRSEGHIKKIRK